MSRIIQTISLLALTAIWLAVVIPGTVSEHGIYWQMLIMTGIFPLAVIWTVFFVSAFRNRSK